MIARISAVIEFQLMHCPDCQSEQIVKNGKLTLQDHTPIQKYLCKACGRQFNDRTGTPMARIRTASTLVALAMNVRTEGMVSLNTLFGFLRSFGEAEEQIGFSERFFQCE